MKNIIKKIAGMIFALMLLVSIIIIFSPSVSAAEDFYTTRVCSNGICIVTVYSEDGSIVNVYEELD